MVSSAIGATVGAEVDLEDGQGDLLGVVEDRRAVIGDDHVEGVDAEALGLARGPAGTRP